MTFFRFSAFLSFCTATHLRRVQQQAGGSITTQTNRKTKPDQTSPGQTRPRLVGGGRWRCQKVSEAADQLFKQHRTGSCRTAWRREPSKASISTASSTSSSRVGQKSAKGHVGDSRNEISADWIEFGQGRNDFRISYSAVIKFSLKSMQAEGAWRILACGYTISQSWTNN